MEEKVDDISLNHTTNKNLVEIDHILECEKQMGRVFKSELR
jgi:hypothetical protein